MKRILVLAVIVSVGIVLTGCSTSFDSSTGLDLEPLDECIDAMVSAQSNVECARDTKLSLMDEYANAFINAYEYEGVEFNHSDLNYSLIRDDSEEIEYWFQFSLLPAGEYLTRYDEYKTITTGMKTELETMNDTPKYILSSEFLFIDDIAYKFHYTQSSEFQADVIIWNLDTEFDATYTEYESFILEKLDDEDFTQIEMIIVTESHNVSIVVDPINNTYTFDIYFTSEDTTLTNAEVENIIITSLTTISFTLQE